MGKSIETVFIELYISEFSKPPSSGSIYQDLNIELSKMGTEELEKQRACTKMKLRECELYSENSTITFGLPIASFVFSVISILVSYGTIIASCLLTAIFSWPRNWYRRSLRDMSSLCKQQKKTSHVPQR